MSVTRIGILLATALACRSGSVSAGPPDATSRSGATQPAKSAKVAVARLNDTQIASFLGQISGQPLASRKVVRDQSFSIGPGGSEQLWFVPTLEERNGATVYVQYEGKPAGPPRRFEDDSWLARAVDAVAFDDVDGDGRRDVTVLLQLARPKGQGGPPFRAARVFRQGAAGLELDWRLTDRANLGKPLTSMTEVRRRLAGKRDLTLPTPSTKPTATAWSYRYAGNIDDQMVACHGRAQLVRAPGDAPCLVWTLIDAHCAGEVAADGLHTVQDPEGPTWHERAEGAQGVGSKICASGKAWTFDQDSLPGQSSCEAKLVPPNPPALPTELSLSCTWQCREPSTCSGQGLYTFQKERSAP